ncbi:hypothetical protein O3M35_011146 [Rhynocoris fuscipes]|uniref:Uncharacterized protein n=1 Tax=Rhynocoris fuscipes TaxID=488301 RepID=A0AAW1CU18_9HEMI
MPCTNNTNNDTSNHDEKVINNNNNNNNNNDDDYSNSEYINNNTRDDDDVDTSDTCSSHSSSRGNSETVARAAMVNNANTDNNNNSNEPHYRVLSETHAFLTKAGNQDGHSPTMNSNTLQDASTLVNNTNSSYLDLNNNNNNNCDVARMMSGTSNENSYSNYTFSATHNSNKPPIHDVYVNDRAFELQALGGLPHYSVLQAGMAGAAKMAQTHECFIFVLCTPADLCESVSSLS